MVDDWYNTIKGDGSSIVFTEVSFIRHHFNLSLFGEANFDPNENENIFADRCKCCLVNTKRFNFIVEAHS